MYMQPEMYFLKALYNEEYWDCMCVKNYIHKKPKNYCPQCGTTQTDSHDSRVSEVESMYNPKEETAIYFASINSGKFINGITK